MDAQFFGSSHLICIFLSQHGGEEYLVKLADRLGILKAASIHLQNDLFEFFLHGGTHSGVGNQRERLKAVTLVVL